MTNGPGGTGGGDGTGGGGGGPPDPSGTGPSYREEAARVEAEKEGKVLETARKRLDLEKERLKMYKDYRDTEDGRLLYAEQNAKYLDAEHQHALKMRDNAKYFNNLSKDEQKELLKKIDLWGDAVTVAKEYKDVLEEQNFTLKKGLKSTKDLGKSLEAAFTTKSGAKLMGQLKGMKKGGGQVVDMAKSMKAAFSASMEVVGDQGFLDFFQMAQGLKAAGMAAKVLIRALGPLLFFAPIISFIAAIADLVFGLDKLSKSFRKGTLASQELANEVTNNYKAMAEFGLSMEQAGKVGKALYGTLTAFTMLSRNERDNVQELVSTFELLGVGADSTTKSLETLTKSFSMTMPTARAEMQRLEAFAESAQLDFKQLVSTLGQSAAALAKFDDPVQTFKELQRVMKITGMEMGDLLRMTNKFDTFDGAATQAGKLNAALGGNFVNAMDLMMATDPVERFEMIRDSILNAGLSFESMSYYQKKYFAEAAGLEDVDDLSKLLSGDMNDLAGSTEAEAKTMKELKDMGYEMLPILEKLKKTFLMVFKDVKAEEMAASLNKITSGLQVFSDMLGTVKVVLSVVLGIFAALGTAAAMAAGWITLPAWGPFAVALGVIAGAWKVLGGSFSDIKKLNPFYWLYTWIGKLMGTMREEKSPSFITIWGFLADKMGIFGKVVKTLLSPLSMLQKVIETIAGVANNITDLFVALMSPGAAENIMKIGAAISDLPTRKTIEFTAAMTAAGGAAMAAATTGNRVATVAGAAEGGTTTAGGRTEQTYNINFKDSNDKITDKYILKVVGRDIESTLRQQKGI